MKTTKIPMLIKPFLLAFFLIFSFNAFAQDALLFTPPLKDDVVYYEKVVPVNGMDKDAIYTRVLDWYLKNFKSFDNDLYTNDIELGQLAAKASFPFVGTESSGGSNYNANFELQVDCKDGKYRYRFTNFKRTSKDVTPTPANSQYVVDVPMENDIAIEHGGVKGFPRVSQKQSAMNRLVALDAKVNSLINDLDKTVNKKAENF